jgi:hypothetical protein
VHLHLEKWRQKASQNQRKLPEREGERIVIRFEDFHKLCTVIHVQIGLIEICFPDAKRAHSRTNHQNISTKFSMATGSRKITDLLEKVIESRINVSDASFAT